MRSWSQRAQAACLALLLVLAQLLGAVPASGQSLDPAIAAAPAEALRVVAQTTVSGVDRIDPLLRQSGHLPAVPEAIWRHFPPVRKLEAAYLAAERMAPGGGERMLALLSREMAQRFEAVRYEPALREYMDRPASPVGYRPQAVDPVSVRLPARATAAIDALAKYAEGGALGGTRGILQHYFDLPPTKVYEILRTSGNATEALRRGYLEIPEGMREARLQRVAADVRASYESARHVAALEAVAKGSPVPPRTGPEARPRRPAVQRTSAPVRVHEQIMRRVYPTPASRSFSGVVASARGFGGVVFGNQVSADPNLPAPVWATWLDGEAEDSLGSLLFHFVDGSERIAGAISPEDVYIAHRLLFVSEPPPVEPGEAVGLVGLEARDDHFELVNDEVVASGRRFAVAIHPALADLDLGWAALMADAWPIADEKLLETVGPRVEDSEAEALADWLANLPGNWKLIDVPLTVVGETGLLGVERTPDSEQTWPVTLRRQAFLAMQRFEGELNETSLAGSDPFYPLVPALVRGCSDFRRLNDFAAVYALLRWARGEGAAFYGPPSRPREVPTPGALIVGDDRLEPAEAGPGEARGELAEDLLERLDELAGQSGLGVQELQRDVSQRVARSLALRASIWSTVGERYEQLAQDQREANLAYLDAPYGSEEETAALVRSEELRSALALLTEEVLPPVLDRPAESVSRRVDEIEEDPLSEDGVFQRLETIAPAGVREQLAGLDDQLATYDRALSEMRSRSMEAMLEVGEISAALEAINIEARLREEAPDAWNRYGELELRVEAESESYWTAAWGSEEEALAEARLEALISEQRALTAEAIPEAARPLMRLAEIEEDLASLVPRLEETASLQQAAAERRRELVQSAYPPQVEIWLRLLGELRSVLIAERFELQVDGVGRLSSRSRSMGSRFHAGARGRDCPGEISTSGSGGLLRIPPSSSSTTLASERSGCRC